MNFIIKLLLPILLISFTNNILAAVEEGPATSYKITMTKLELCTGAPLSLSLIHI